MKKRNSKVKKQKVGGKKTKKTERPTAKDAVAFGLGLAFSTGMFKKNGW